MVAVLSLALGACQGGGGPGSGGGGERGTDGGGDDGTNDGPTGSELVVRVESAGGFLPREAALASLPEVTILGDGRVITLGPQIAIYPGPALPNLQERRLTEAGVDEVVRLLEDSGYFERSFQFAGASNFIADAHTTYFTFNDGSQTVTVSIYGLGTVDNGSLHMIPEPDRTAYVELQALRDALLGLETWLPADAWADAQYRQHVPEALRVYVREIAAGEEQPEDIEPQRLEWPLATPLAEFGTPGGQDAPDLRCGVVSGAEANQLLEAFAEANVLTRWQSEGIEYAMIVRPLLPDDPLECV